MDQQPEVKVQNNPVIIGEKPVSALYKKLFVGLMFLFILIGITGGAYFMGKTQSAPVVTPSPTLQPTQAIVSPSAIPSNGVIVSPTTKVAKDENIVPIGQNTVSFARAGDKTYLRYRGKIYDDLDQLNPHEVNIANPDQYTWYGLVDAPSDISAGQFMYDEVFGFKVAPDGRSLAVVMRWGKEGGAISYYIYYYSAFEKYQQSLLVNKFTPDSEGLPMVAKIDQFSPDGKFLALNMYGCWNCGGHKPETLLVRLKDYEMKRIGKTSYFVWKNDGAYEYKDYIVITCTEETMGECSEKPEGLSLKTGQF